MKCTITTIIANLLMFLARTKMAQLANIDPSWSLGNGMSSNHPSQLRLYLAACKLLDLALILPADALPQFQLYVLLLVMTMCELLLCLVNLLPLDL